MKKHRHINTYIQLAIILLISFNGVQEAKSQDNVSANETLRVYFDCGYHVLGSKRELIGSAKARIGENNKIMPVSDLEVLFYYKSDTGDIYLGSAVSNVEGKAIFVLDEQVKFLPNEDGEINFAARFKGNEKFKKASASVSIVEVTMELAFIEIDSVKTIQAKAFRVAKNGETENLEDVKVNFYVPGSFSLLKIGEKSFENGETSVIFPVSLPGDSVGNLTIIAKMESNEEFGIVESHGIKNWGTPHEIRAVEKRSRGLGDTDAPLWMVYTLIVLLSAVWVHYIYVFFVIRRINKQGMALKIK